MTKKYIDLEGLRTFKNNVMDNVINKPSEVGTVGQILSLDANGNSIWRAEATGDKLLEGTESSPIFLHNLDYGNYKIIGNFKIAQSLADGIIGDLDYIADSPITVIINASDILSDPPVDTMPTIIPVITKLITIISGSINLFLVEDGELCGIRSLASKDEVMFKLDRPELNGTSGQILSLDADGKTIWKNESSGGGGNIETVTNEQIDLLFLDPLIKFTMDKPSTGTVTDLPYLPVMKEVKYDINGQNPTDEIYFNEYNIKYVINDNIINITQADMTTKYDNNDNHVIATYIKSDILTKFNSYLIDGENIVEIYDMNNTVNWISTNNSYVSENSISLINDILEINMIVKSCKCMFSGVKGIINLNGFNTSDVTDMGYMFSNCMSISTLNISNFDTSNVTDMCFMFDNCRSITSLDLNNFNTSKVTDMSGMFAECVSLASLNTNNFNTSKVTNMNGTFYKCSSLTSLNLSNFDTSNVTNMSGMFAECISISVLNTNNFNTSKVTNMNSMFYKCSSLTSLNLSNFDTSNVTNMRNLFAENTKLTSLNIANFNLVKTSNILEMFLNSTALTRANIVLTNVSPESIVKLEAGGMPKA